MTTTMSAWSFTGWVLLASLLGFAVSAVFAGWMKLSRNRFLVPYVVLVGGFLYAFVTLNHLDLAAALAHQWGWGLLAGALASLLLVRHVRSQPASRRSQGAGLAFDLTWAGLVYGLVDALFLNVMPVLAVWGGTASLAGTLPGRLAAGALALLASLLVTLTYHLGYPEFRGRRVGRVLVGNGLMTLAFVLSGSPLGPLVSHPVMHIAAVLQGAETTIQLPPHYRPVSSN